MPAQISTINRVVLKTKLDRKEDLHLVMTMDIEAFNNAHIPGSVRFDCIDETCQEMACAAEIVLYCSDSACVHSQSAYHELVRRGYTNVRHYKGGLTDWADAGYKLASNRN